MSQLTEAFRKAAEIEAETPIAAGSLCKPKTCPLCGRFLRKDGSCIKVFYDDWNGAWDHA